MSGINFGSDSVAIAMIQLNAPGCRIFANTEGERSQGSEVSLCLLGQV